MNIFILSSYDNNSVYTMFTSENDHKNDLNLFYYKDHICLIKDLNKYLFRNNPDKNKKFFVYNVYYRLKHKKTYKNIKIFV